MCWRAMLGLPGWLSPGSTRCFRMQLGNLPAKQESSSGSTGNKTQGGFERWGKKDTGEAFIGAPEGEPNYRPKADEAPNCNKRLFPAGARPYQGVPLHVLPAGELLPADLAGIRSLSRVGSHVSLQDALMHGRKTAVRALEFLPDDCELVDCKRTKHADYFQNVSKQSVFSFTISLLAHCEITLSPLNHLQFLKSYTILLHLYY